MSWWRSQSHRRRRRPWSFKTWPRFVPLYTIILYGQQMNVGLFVYHNRVFDGDFLTIQKLVSERRLGDVVEFISSWDSFSPSVKPGAWRETSVAASGVLYDLGSHMIHQGFLFFYFTYEK